jgi:hypothetical protein
LASPSLPANVLRFYIEFSAPAEADFEREKLRLRTATGEVIQDAFLMLNGKLWSTDGRRLTIFMEPDRIRRDMGPAKNSRRQSYQVLPTAEEFPDADGV